MLAKPDWTATDHADWLDKRHRMNRLDDSVDLALTMSYLHLPDGQRRLLRLLALHPGNDADIYAAAALIAADTAVTGTDIATLVRQHLLLHDSDGRYALHDLVRVFAAQRAADEERGTDQHAALTRLFDHYVAVAAAAAAALFPADLNRYPDLPAPAPPAPDVTAADAAREWLERERPVLVAAAAHMAEHGWSRHITALSVVLFRYLAHSYAMDALIVHGHAREASRRAHDLRGEAYARYGLGVAYGQVGLNSIAVEHLEGALALFTEVQDVHGQARALDSLGAIEGRRGRYQAAGERHRRALELFGQAADPAGEARALTNLGTAEERLGRLDLAVTHRQDAARLFARIGDQSGEAYALGNLAEAELKLGRLAAALTHNERALALYRRVGIRAGEAWTLVGLGDVHAALEDHPAAEGWYERALALFEEVGEPAGLARTLNGLAGLALTRGDASSALRLHRAAFETADEAGEPNETARAHIGLGAAHTSVDDLDRARAEYARALALLDRVDDTVAAELRAILRRADDR
jgi:tetratricopeptide (TPR) repeat protein